MKSSKINKPYPHFNSKHVEICKKEQIVQFQPTQKYTPFKNSVSLPSYYMNKTRIKKITEIYRALSSDKINPHSAGKSRRNSPSQTPQKKMSLYHRPFTSVNANLQNNGQASRQKVKLSLQRGTQNNPYQNTSQTGNTSWAHLTNKLRTITDKLTEILSMNIDKHFQQQFERYLITLREAEKNRGIQGKQHLYNLLSVFQQCMSRRQLCRTAETKLSLSKITDELNILSMENKKKTIRALLDQKDIEKLQVKNKHMESELTDLKAKLDKQLIDVGVNTDFNFTKTKDSNDYEKIFQATQILSPNHLQLNYQRKACNCEKEGEQRKIRLAQCFKKIQSYSKRQKELLRVLVVLRSEGVDVERVYDDVVNGRIEVPEEDEQQMMQSAQKMKRQEQQMYKKYKNMQACNQFDADDSILSSADGLSFNYEQKSLQEDVFTVRRQYKCKKQLQASVKQKLKLNFNILYDEQLYEDDYESEEQHENPPTI